MDVNTPNLDVVHHQVNTKKMTQTDQTVQLKKVAILVITDAVLMKSLKKLMKMEPTVLVLLPSICVVKMVKHQKLTKKVLIVVVTIVDMVVAQIP